LGNNPELGRQYAMTEINSINFDAVWEYVIKAFQCGRDSIHGPDHWRRVERNALKIASSNGAIVSVVRLFAVFHDSRRENDSFDLEHGKRGARYAASLRGTLFDLGDSHFDMLQYACTWHTHGQLSKDPTIGACWDADRLDLTRIGLRPEPRFMSTAVGRSLSVLIGNKSLT
jgi:uncharacterized protein